MLPSFQYIVNGISAGSTYALLAFGFGLIFHIARFFNLAHGGIYTIGGYSAFTFLHLLNLPPWIALPSAIIITGLVGVGTELLVFRPLRQRGGNPLTALIASLGLLIIIQNVISLSFGDASKTLSSEAVQPGYLILETRVTLPQLATIFSTLFIFGLLWAFLRFSRYGKMMRAVANDPELARIVGIRSQAVIIWTFAISSVLAGLSAILAGYSVDLTPVMGFKALLMAVVVVIVGGKGSIAGALLGGFLIGLIEQLSVWMMPNQWKDLVVFLVLIIFLLFRPQGFFGNPIKKVNV